MTREERRDRQTPRMRDLPAPRKNPSLAGPLFRTLWAWPYRFALSGLHRMGVRPWQLTLLSLIGNAICGWLIVTGRHFLGGILLLPAGLFDVFDGGVARLRGEESRKGALLDAASDRVADGIVLGAILYSLVSQDRTEAGLLCLAALIVSLFVSHVRAEGEARRIDMSGGLFQRLERYIVLVFGLTVPGMLGPVLGVLTALGLFTIIQRGVHAWRRLPPVGA